jgi:hypothetical protein
MKVKPAFLASLHTSVAMAASSVAEELLISLTDVHLHSVEKNERTRGLRVARILNGRSR